MSNSTVQILARVLRVLLIFALLLNVLALLLVPASVMVNAENLFGGAGTFLHDLFHPDGPHSLTPEEEGGRIANLFRRYRKLRRICSECT